jgi:Na+-driven multidrug efflux pump
MSFFTDDHDVVAMGREFFMVIAITEPFMAFAFALGGALRGGGDPVSPFIYASTSDILVVIIVGYLLAVQLKMGFTGIAIGVAVSAVTRAIPTTLRFRRGAWRTTRL